MKRLLGFAILCFLVFGLVKVLDWFGVDTPHYPMQIRSDFADSALQVVSLIEKGHNHQLELGKDEPPNYAVTRLRTNAHDWDENFIVDNVNSLELIVDANAENEYYQCDAEINSVLRSRVMPKIPFPDCR